MIGRIGSGLLCGCLLLTACGAGGGGGVRPTPAPPAPTPTPTPTSNNDLVAPLVSETFTNDAAHGTASYPKSGSTGTAAVAATQLTISYDAANETYTISGSSRTQSFGSGDIDPALSGGEATVYVRTNGNTTNSLSVSKAGNGEGTPLNPTFRYVGGGVWQRTIDGSSSIDGSIDAFAFGVETPDATLVRTGSGSYAVQLRGVIAYGDTVTGARGAGNVSVNFVTGAIGGSGEISTVLADGTPIQARRWGMSAQLSSSANAFAGAFGLSGAGPSPELTGFVNGRLYGPNAEELGAAFGWRDPSLGTTYAGYMLGKDDRLFPENTTLANLVVEQALPNHGYIYRYTDLGTGISAPGEPNPPSSPQIGLRFSESGGALEINSFPVMDRRLLTPASRDAAASDATYDVYRFTDPVVPGVTRAATVHMFKPGASNPELQLTYASFGYWRTEQDDRGYTNVTRGYFAYGLPTPASMIPTSGTGTYDGLIVGQSKFAFGAHPDIPMLDISGTVRLAFDFGAGSLSGFIRPVGRDPESGISHDLGQFDFKPDFSMFESTFRGFFVDGPSINPGYFEGHFMGPSAQELAGRFHTPFIHPMNGATGEIFGVFVAKQTPSP